MVPDVPDMPDVMDETANGANPDRQPQPQPSDAGAGARGPFDLNDQQKRILIAVLIVHVILARFTLRDLRRRSDEAVRGPKRLWRVWATTNTTGSLAYWLFGRRRGPSAPTV